MVSIHVRGGWLDAVSSTEETARSKRYAASITSNAMISDGAKARTGSLDSSRVDEFR
jgi:hypothetical protein